MLTDPDWKPDPSKVRAMLADHERAVLRGRLLAEALRDASAAAEDDLAEAERLLAMRREAWAGHGVDVTPVDPELRDRALIARHLRTAASAVGVTDWPAYLRQCADAHEAGTAWYQP